MSDIRALALQRQKQAKVGFGEASDRQEMQSRLEQLEQSGQIRAGEAETLAELRQTEARDQNRMGATFATGRGFAKGATFNLRDELAGLISGAGARDRVRAADKQAEQNFPQQFAAGEVSGALGTSAAGGFGAAKLLKAGGPLKTMLQGAGIGAVEGGINGFADGEGFQDRLDTGFHRGAFGAAGGAAAPGVSMGLTKLSQAASNPVRGMIDSMVNRASPQRANRALANGIERTGQTPDELQAALSAAKAEGQGQFVLADAMGNPGQRMLAGVARQPGAYKTDVVEQLRKRQTDQSDRISQFLAEGLDAPDTAAARAAGLKMARGDAANVNYEAARGNAGPVDTRGAQAAMEARVGPMRGAGISGDSIDGKMAKYLDRLRAKNPAASQLGDTGLAPSGADATPTSVELSDFDRVLGVKQELQDDVGAALRAGRNNEARELGKIVKQIDEALEASSDGYRKANDTFRADTQTMDAVDQGRDFTRPSSRAQDNVATFQGMTPDQQAAARAGYADPLMARIQSGAEGVNKARPLTSTKVQAELGAMANDPQKLTRQIDRENTMFETGNAALGGSKTADNLADMDDVGGMDAGLMANLLTGRWGSAATDGLRMAGSAAKGQNEATRALIAQALMSSDPQKAIASAIGQADRDRITRRLLDSLTRQGAIQGSSQ